VLGLLWYVQRRVGKRMQKRRDGAEITVIARQALGAKAQLVVVETDDARYVLGVTEHGVNLIERTARGHVTRPVVHVGESAPSTSDVSSVPSGPSGPADAGDSAFDQLLAAERASEQPPLRRHRRPSRQDPLAGSILSAQTWRQTAQFVRRPR
jgi:flagellar protein FliO/FliZ